MVDIVSVTGYLFRSLENVNPGASNHQLSLGIV